MWSGVISQFNMLLYIFYSYKWQVQETWKNFFFFFSSRKWIGRMSIKYGCFLVGSFLSIPAGEKSKIMQLQMPFCCTFYFFLLSILSWMSGNAKSANYFLYLHFYKDSVQWLKVFTADNRWRTTLLISAALYVMK